MNIAVIDDCKDDLYILKNYILEYFSDDNIDIDIYINGEEFIEVFKSKKYDIVFLDIYMSGLTGIEISKIIFETDKNCKIVFITTSNSFASESYDVEAVGYIIKPVDKVRIKNLLDKCLSDLEKDNKYINFISAKNAYHIAYKDIVYVDNIMRKIRIHLCNNLIEINDSFYKNVDILLEDKRFIECCRCVIVNMDHIIKIQGDDFIMDNNETVPIRKRNRKEIHKKYMRYKIGEM